MMSPVAGTLDPYARTVPATDLIPAELLDIGSMIDHYRIDRFVGSGGMGIVYAATDTTLNRPVAIKVVRRQLSAVAHDRLVREAQAMAAVSHPSVVPVYEVRRYDDRVFVVMELVPGNTLRGWLDEGRPWRDVLATMILAGRGLAAAHAAGIVHGDFKPDNVLIHPDGRACVTDFGLARNDVAGEAVATGAASPVPTATGTGQIAGTPAYMAPEAHLGRGIDARSDQFSFCVALWEALHGERPFDRPGDDAFAIARAAIMGRRRPPRRSRTIPRRLQALLERGLVVDPARRWASLDELLHRLARVPHRRRTFAIAATSALGLAVTVLATIAITARSRASSTSPMSDPALVERIAQLDFEHPVALHEVSALRGDYAVFPDGRVVAIGNEDVAIVDRTGRSTALALPDGLIPASVSAIGSDHVAVFGRTHMDIRRTQLWRIDTRSGAATLEMEDIGGLMSPGVEGGRARVSPDGRYAVFATVHELVLFDLIAHRRTLLLAVPDDSSISCVTWTADPRKIAFVEGLGTNQRATVLDVVDRHSRVIYTGMLLTALGECGGISFVETHAAIVVDFTDNATRAWLVSTDDERTPVQLRAWPGTRITDVRWDRTRLLHRAMRTGRQGIVRVPARASLPSNLDDRLIPLDGTVSAVLGALSDGRLVYSLGRDGKMYLMVGTGDAAESWGEGIVPVAIVGDEVFGLAADRVVRMRGPGRRTDLDDVRTLGIPRCAMNGACVSLQVGPHATIRAFDASTGALGPQLAEIAQAVRRHHWVALSPNGMRLAIASFSADIVILDLGDRSTRTLSSGLAYAMTPTWIDDRDLALVGVGLGPQSIAIVRVDTGSGAITPIAASDSFLMERAGLAPDGDLAIAVGEAWVSVSSIEQTSP